jgi:hypothetical protein
MDIALFKNSVEQMHASGQMRLEKRWKHRGQLKVFLGYGTEVGTFFQSYLSVLRL